MAMHPTTGPAPYHVLRTISAEALLQELRSDVPLTILDVRDRSEVHATGMIAEARTIPRYQVTARIEELIPLRMTPIVVVSQRGRRARAVALELELAGFSEVFVLDSGFERWLALGYPVEERSESVRAFRP